MNTEMKVLCTVNHLYGAVDQDELPLTLCYYYNVTMSSLLWNADEAIGEHP